MNFLATTYYIVIALYKYYINNRPWTIFASGDWFDRARSDGAARHAMLSPCQRGADWAGHPAWRGKPDFKFTPQALLSPRFFTPTLEHIALSCILPFIGATSVVFGYAFVGRILHSYETTCSTHVARIIHCLFMDRVDASFFFQKLLYEQILCLRSIANYLSNPTEKVDIRRSQSTDHTP